MRGPAPAWALCAAVMSALGVARSAAAQSTKNVCVSAFEEGQRHQLKGDLERAAEQFTLCTDAACPPRVRAECQSFLENARSAVPGLLFSAVDAVSDRPLDGVAFSVDGAAAQPYDGRMVRLPPGEHLLSFQRSGYAPIAVRITLGAGDPPRIVPLRFTSLPPSASRSKPRAKAPPPLVPGQDLPRPTAAAEPLECAPIADSRAAKAAPAGPRASVATKPAPPPARQATGARRTALIAAGVTGGVGALGFAYFGLSARSADVGLDACTPNCETSKVDAIKRDYVLANVSLAVGVAGVAAASVLWLTSPRTERRWALGLGPITTLSTRF